MADLDVLLNEVRDLIYQDRSAALEHARQLESAALEAEHYEHCCESISIQAYCLSLLGRQEEALAEGHRAVDLAAAYDLPQKRARALMMLGVVHNEMDLPALAMEPLQEALHTAEQLPGEEVAVASILANLSVTACACGDSSGALDHAQNAVEYGERHGIERNRAARWLNLGATHSDYGQELRRADYPEEAVSHFEKAQAALEQARELGLQGTDSLIALYAKTNLMCLASMQGEHLQAAQRARRALRMARQHPDPSGHCDLRLENALRRFRARPSTKRWQACLRMASQLEETGRTTRLIQAWLGMAEEAASAGLAEAAVEAYQRMVRTQHSREMDQAKRRAEMMRVKLETDRARRENDELRRHNEFLRQSLDTDGLTLLLNRRAFEAWKDQERGWGLLLAVDIDHFKKINDRFGHFVGDEALRQFSSLAARTVGESGACYRIGGEEFIVVLPRLSEEGGLEVAERIRHSVENWDWGTIATGLRLTVSIGLAPYSPGMLTNSLRLADDRLYQAKRFGRNQICSGEADLGLAA